MEDQSKNRERRNSFRFKMVYPVIYTRFDDQGRKFDQKPSRSTDMSLGGVRLQSNFRVDSGEVLDITMALQSPLVEPQDRLLTFMGKVTYLIRSQDQDIELGVSIQEIEDRERTKLGRFIQRIVVSDFEHDKVTISMGQIVCPNCGEQIMSVAKLKKVVAAYRGFKDQCICGQRYEGEPYLSDAMVLSFPDKQIELLC